MAPGTEGHSGDERAADTTDDTVRKPPTPRKSPMENLLGRGRASPPPDEVPLNVPGDGPDVLSFKRRRSRDPLGSVRRWLHSDRASILEGPGLRHLRNSGAPEGWEHPARYVSASHVTVPTVLPTPESTPIPMLPYTVLCLLIFGEFCSAGVAGPFLFFMLNDFQVGDESRVGFWAGILAAVFFFAQFLTSLLWASAAEKHGRRLVLQVSLVGSTVSLLAFGFSPNLAFALLFRLAQGFFNGAVGVAKGAVRDLTDETNESRAYAQMGFCWGMGGIIGPILGGLLEHPAQKYPWLFGHSVLLQKYPYALPCALAASSTALGTILSLFLEPHAGPSGVRLPDDDAPHSVFDDGWRSPSVAATPDDELDEDEAMGHSEVSGPTAPSYISRGRMRESQFSRMRNPSNLGTAYGLDSMRTGPSSVRMARNRSDSLARSFRRAPSMASTSRMSFFNHDAELPESQYRASNMSMLERFVLANDDAVLSITDLWVAAATNNDEGHPMGDSPNEPFHEDDDGSEHDEPYHDTPPLFGTSFADREAPRAQPYLPPAHFAKMHRGRSQMSRMSKLPDPVEAAEVSEMPTSLWVLIPVVVIAHYATLSFHSSMFDQIFLSFLVTPEPSGGLGLNAGHYAALIASMALCQLLFQFRVYPNVGPPNGPLSHLSMLQWGLVLYLPCYTLFPFLRTFLLPNTDVLVMLAMIACATLRWLANVVSFTAIMVLLNAWTPPHLVPLANGLAQTVSSAARCVGPIIGGMVWAQSIQGGPKAHPWPLNFHLGFWVVGLVAFAEWFQARWLRDRI